MNYRQIVQMPRLNTVPRNRAAQRSTSHVALEPPAGQIQAALGRPIDPATRTLMESRFDHDFSQVRIHTDSQAARFAAGHDAVAITTGRDVYFDHETYAPTTPAGRMILAHELAHVVQVDRREQRAAAAASNLESEALTAGLQVAAGQAAHVQLAATDRPVLALSRTWKAILGGAVAGAAVLGVAALIGVASIGLGSGLLSILGGGLAGWGIERLQRGERSVDTPVEADAVIQDQYGVNIQRAMAAQYIPAGRSAKTAKVNVVGEEGFKRAYQLKYGEIDAEYYSVAGFVDEALDPPLIWIHYNRKQPTTLIHECLHYYSLPVRGKGFLGFGFNVNEGTTEYFTRQIAQKNKIPPGNAYPHQYPEVQALVAALGDEGPLRRAYFEGQIDDLRLAVDGVRGAGAFSRWVVAMRLGHWAEARSALKTRNSAQP